MKIELRYLYDLSLRETFARSSKSVDTKEIEGKQFGKTLYRSKVCFKGARFGQMLLNLRNPFNSKKCQAV